MKKIIIIPARMGSSRFPGKPLKKIKGISMIERVYKNSSVSNLISTTYIATCDKEIYQHVKSFGGNVVMTSKKHKRASDRCAEALIKIEKIKKTKFDIVLMIQGDEPMVNKNMIKQVLSPFSKDKDVNVVNLIYKFNSIKEAQNINTIKVVKDNNNNAIYFTRSLIPHNTTKNKNQYFKQVCLIPFKRNFLLRYIKMKPTVLEIKESIDMLRILEHGYDVKLVETKYFSHAVDNLKDLKVVEKYI
tara:strand:- start:463 stop:1197 length:735 start_codon:yes stop_codon:yes gene_type:complete